MIDDPEIRAVSGILLELCLRFYYVNSTLFDILVCRIVKLSIQYGHSEACTVGYGLLGASLGPVSDRFEDGERFAQLAVAVSERHRFLAQRTGSYFLLHMALAWTRTIDEAMRCLDAGNQAAVETGEVVFACYCATYRIMNLLARGEPLDLIWPETTKTLTFVREKGYAHQIDSIGATQRFISALTADPSHERLTVTDAAAMLQTAIPIVQCRYWTFELQLQYLMGNPVGALAAVEKAKPVLWSARRHIEAGTFAFYHALTLAAVIRTSAAPKQSALRHELEGALAALRKLADRGPHTYAHKHLLVTAELAGLEGRDLEAMRLYEQAVCSAAEKGFVQEAALGAELAARVFRRPRP